MRAQLLLIVATLAAAAEQAPASKATNLLAGAQAADRAAHIPEANLAKVRGMRTMLVVGSDHSPLARGLAVLAKKEVRYQLRIANSPASVGWYKDGAVGIHRAPSAVRADKAAETFARLVKRDGASLDLAAIELAPDAFPNGRQIQMPYRQFSAGMDINVSNKSLDGVFTENITTYAQQGNGNNGVINQNVTYPIELPNVGINHLSTHTSVRAGLGADDVGWQIEGNLPPSPRDPRQAIRDMHKSIDLAATERPSMKIMWTTMPLAVRGNGQRNWYNQHVRTYTAERNIPLLDIAEIMATGPDGKVATDAEGHTLAPGWVTAGSTAANEELHGRVAAAYWWAGAKLSGWDGVAVGSSASNTTE